MKRSIKGGDPQSTDLIKGLAGGEGKQEDFIFLEVVNGYMPSDNEFKSISNATVYSHRISTEIYLFWRFKQL